MARSQSVNGSGNQSLAVDYGLVDSHGARAPRLRDDEDERSIYVDNICGLRFLVSILRKIAQI